MYFNAHTHIQSLSYMATLTLNNSYFACAWFYKVGSRVFTAIPSTTDGDERIEELLNPLSSVGGV
jgi:hypothetical protein